MPPLLTKCHYSISWLPTVTLVSLWYLLVPSVTKISPGGHTGALISIQYFMVAHCYPRVTTVAYGGPLVFSRVITVSHDGCTVTLMSLEYLMVVPLLQ